MNKKDRIKKVKGILKRAEKAGVDLFKVTEGKGLDTLAHNKTTIANLQKRIKRQKEQFKIQEFFLKRLEEKNKKIRRSIITDESIATIKWSSKNIKEQDITKTMLKKETDEVASDFFNRFFKEIRLEKEAQKKINKLKKRFGVRIDRVYDLMEYVADYSFKYEIDREIMKEETIEDFRSLLYDRLDEFDRIINREYKL